MKTSFTDIKGIKKDANAVEHVGGVKQVKFAGFKISPTVPTKDQLAKINQLTRREFKAEELYIGQMRLSNNAIDRDNERFSEETIQRFVTTTLRKTMLLNHDRADATGKFFDVELEKLPLQQANAETGQNFKLSDGMTEVWFHSPWFYIPIEGIDPKELVKIDASIYDWASIGFRAESIVPIRSTEKGKEDVVLFWEYRGNGDETEMTEGSLVYLGAQYGMGVKSVDGGAEGNDNKQDKGPDDNHKQQSTATPPAPPAQSKQGGINTMTLEELLASLKIYFGRTFSKENIFDELKTAHIEKIDEGVKAATKPLNDEIKRLQPIAADGTAYRNSLMTEYVGLKVKLGEASEKPENQDALKEVVATYPIDFLKAEIGLLKSRVYAKFPSEAQLSAGDFDRTSGKSKKNPLIPEAER